MNVTKLGLHEGGNDGKVVGEREGEFDGGAEGSFDGLLDGKTLAQIKQTVV
jgi:hypothetical protein